MIKIIFLLLVILNCYQSINLDELKKIQIESLERTVDIKSQFAKSHTTLKLVNGNDHNINRFYFALPKALEDKLILFIIKARGSSKELSYQIVEDLNLKSRYNITLYEVKLDKYIPTGEKLQLTITEQYYNRMDPLPKQITLLEDQFVIFSDNVLFYSPYKVVDQKTTYKMPSTPISYTELIESSVRSGVVEYGLFADTDAFSNQQIKIHFENNIPFVVLKKVEKIITVSHWGNINVEGFYKIANEGAKLVGEYGRVDYSPYKPQSGKSALRSLKAELPYHANGVYYFDEIGNISTSHAHRDHSEKEVKIELKPRFSIFGGWKSNMFLGYNLPLQHYLFSNDNMPDQLTLKQYFGFPFENLLAEDYQLKIVLPEGSKNIKANLPFEIDSQELEKTYSYIDPIGRPTLILKKKFVSQYHHKQFQINYTFRNVDLLIEPFLLFCVFFVFFSLLIILKRLNFKSLKRKDE